MDNNNRINSIESDSFFWFGLLSFSEVIDKMSQSATQLIIVRDDFIQMWCSLYTSRCAQECSIGC